MLKILYNHKGFTLLEVVVAIVIISSLALAFAPLIVSSVERIRWAGQRTQELYQERSQMEKLVASASASASSEAIITLRQGERLWQIKGAIVKTGNFVTFLPEQEQ